MVAVVISTIDIIVVTPRRSSEFLICIIVLPPLSGDEFGFDQGDYQHRGASAQAARGQSKTNLSVANSNLLQISGRFLLHRAFRYQNMNEVS
jgi:hypothetical protein